jgi:hypothetical protein
VKSPFRLAYLRVRWRVLSEEVLELTSTPNTGYRIEYSPSRENVKRVTLQVWAKRSTNIMYGPLNNPNIIKVKVKVSFGPPGQVFAEAIGRATVAAAASAKASATAFQSEEITKLTTSIQRLEEISRRSALNEIETTIAQFESGTATSEISLDKIRKAKAAYLASLDHLTFGILNLPKKWSKVYKYHEDMGLPVIEPALKAILEEKLAFIQAQKNSFEIDFNSSFQDITGHRPMTEESGTSSAPLYGSYCLFQSDPLEACNNSDYYRFYGHYFCKEPSKDTNGIYVEPIANYDTWVSNFEGRQYTGACPPLSLERFELPTIVSERPPMAPRPAKPQQLPELGQSFASETRVPSPSQASTHALHWARQFHTPSAGSTSNISNQHFLTPPFPMSNQQQMRQIACVQQMVQNQQIYQMQQAQCQLQLHQAQAFQQAQCMQQAQCTQQMQQAQAFNQMQCVQKMQQEQCMQQMQGGAPFTGFCTPSQLANPTAIIFPPMNTFGGYY